MPPVPSAWAGILVGGWLALRSLWNGAISFGLVHIPCRLFAATEDRDVHFRQLHAECHTPIAYRKTCPRCRREVSAQELVRGVEVNPGQFVVLSPEELPEQEGGGERTVEVLDFVELSEVDPLYFSRSYFVGPGSGGARPYALLREVLRTKRRAAVARIALRGKGSLALLRVLGQALVLELMHDPDEIRPWAEMEGLPGEVAVGARELEVAGDLVERLSVGWQPQRYQNAYRNALAEVVARKADSGPAMAPAARPDEGYADLLAALEASVQAAQRQDRVQGAARR